MDTRSEPPLSWRKAELTRSSQELGQDLYQADFRAIGYSIIRDHWDSQWKLTLGTAHGRPLGEPTWDLDALKSYAQRHADVRSSASPGIRHAREALGMTAAELSKRSGVQPAQLSRYENGWATPRLPTLARILYDLGMMETFMTLEPFLSPADAFTLRLM